MRVGEWTPREDEHLLRLREEKKLGSAEIAEWLTKKFGRPFSQDAVLGRLRRVHQPKVEKAPLPPVGDPEARSLAELRERKFKEQIRELQETRERLLGQLHDAHEQIGLTKELYKAPKPIVKAKGRGEGKRRVGTPVILLSDWHVEEPVNPETVNGLNEYNLDIAAGCISKCADAFEWLSNDKRYECRDAVIWLGGDLLSGYIHDELQEQNFLSPVQAAAWLQEKIELMLLQILKSTNFEKIKVICNDGNHGRLTHKTRVATRTANSLEWFLYHTLARRLSNEKRLEFHIADGEYSYLDVYDATLCFFHGDSVKYMGGVGGLLIPMRRGLNEHRKYRPVSCYNFGHFHTRLDMPDMVGNGSMIGITPYALSKKFSPEPRQQSWYMWDSTRGKCLSAPVWL